VGKANCQADCNVIRSDVDSKRSDSLQMQFNVDKCKVLHFGSNSMKFTYKLDGGQLRLLLLLFSSLSVYLIYAMTAADAVSRSAHRVTSI